MITKKDYFLAALIGFLVAIFAIPTLFNLGVGRPLVFLALVLILPILWAFGVWLGGYLSRWFSFFGQFGKFAAVGFSSAAIDFGVLNTLSILSGVTAGFILGGVNIPGFSVAVLNGYLWNKLWVFKDRDKENLFHDFPKFLAVTVIGLLLNSGIIILLTTYFPLAFGFREESWLNIAKVLATAVVMIWNFTGYKFVVFKK